MKLTAWAIKNNRVTLVALIAIIIAGVTAFRTIPQQEDPGFTIRVALVMTYFPGASPTRMEELVTDKLEKAIQEIPELDRIDSTTKLGQSAIYVRLKTKYSDLQPIWDKLRRKIDGIKMQLPSGTIGPFVNDEFGDVFGTVLSITGEDFSYQELKKVADSVRDELLHIDDVAKVSILGTQSERIFIEFDHAKLSKLGIPPLYIKQLLDQQNIIIPGGDIVLNKLERITLEPSGNLTSVAEIGNIVVRLPGKQKVFLLKDLVSIRRGYIEPATQKVHADGKVALSIAISMKEGGSIIQLGKDVKQKIAKIKGQYPLGINFDFSYFQPEEVSKTVNDFVMNLGQSIIIVMLVMLLSLGLKTGILISTLIPMTVILTIFLMSVFHISVNQVSLGALLIALGMLVDNAIVVSESILVQMSHGKKALDAALSATKELYKPLLISSLITSSAFLPIALADSDVGDYTLALYQVVTITLLSSWVLALTMIPLLCVKFLKVKIKEGKDGYSSLFYRVYRGLLLWVLRHKIITITIVLGTFSGALYMSQYVPKAFFPSSTKTYMTLNLNMPPGTPMERTEAVVQDIEDYITANFKVNENRPKGVLRWASYIGQSAPRFVLSYGPKPPTEEYAYLLVTVTHFDEIKKYKKKLIKFVREHHPDLKLTVRPLPLGPPVDYPIAIRIVGKEMENVDNIADQVRAKLATINDISFITDNWGAQIKKLKVNVKQTQAYHSGVTNQDVAVSLLTALNGYTISSFREGDKSIPIVLRAKQQDRNSIEQLDGMSIQSMTTRDSSSLSQIADIEPAFEPSKILRRNRYRTITIQAELKEGVMADSVNRIVLPWLKDFKALHSDEAEITLAGEAESSQEANDSIMAKLPIAGIIIFLLLVLQFNSIRKPILLLLTVPLGFIGVISGLLIADSYFGFMTLLAIISLSGIVINNANVLMDRIRIEIDEVGLDPRDAIIQAATTRLRPILLTTLTTVGGLIPLWLGGGPMWEPMAIALIFGLLFATVLTTIVIPLLYSIFHRIKYKREYIFNTTSLS